MYLYGSKSVYPFQSKVGGDDELAQARDVVESVQVDFDEVVLQEQPWVEVKFLIGYWRKANAIHKWFVDNCAGGEDDCRDVTVEREDLERLRDECRQVIDGSKLVEGELVTGTVWSKAEGSRVLKEPGKVVGNSELADALLPTGDGFFFGSTDYNQWYIDELRATVETIDRALKLPEGFGMSFIYRASW